MKTIEIDGVRYQKFIKSDRLVEFKRVLSLPQPTTPLRRSLIRKSIAYKCSKCGSHKDLQAHHKDKAVYNKTLKGHYHQICSKTNNDSENGMFLCRSCHRELHRTH